MPESKKKENNSKNIGEENLEIYHEYNTSTSRRDWMEEGDLNENYYYSKQFDSDMQDILRDRGQLAVPVNRMRPLIRHFIASVTANNPAFTVTAKGSQDYNKSWIFKGYIADILAKNFIMMTSGRAIKDMAIRGLGNLFVDFDPHARYGRGEVIIKYLTSREAIWDPNCTEINYNDAVNVILTKVIPTTKAKELYPKMRSKIDNVEGHEVYDFLERMETSETDEGSKILIEQNLKDNRISTQKYVRIIQRYKKQQVTAWIVQDKMGRIREYYSEERLFKYLQQLMNQGIEFLPPVEIPLTRVVRYTSIMQHFVNSEILPLSEYPIIPIINEDTKNPFPLGEAQFMRPLQDIVNKGIAITIHNAQIASNPRVWIDKTAAAELGPEGIQKLEEKFARSGAILHEVDDPQKNVHESGGQLLNPAFLQIVAVMQKSMETGIAINPQDMGDPTESPRTATATQAIHEWGKQNIALALKSINSSFTLLGKVVMSYIQSECRFEDIIRLNVDGIENLEEMMQQQEQLGEGMAKRDGAEIEVKINKMIQESNDITRYLNDLSVGEYDVVVVPDSFLYTDRQARVQQMLELKQNQIVDNVAVLNELDIKDRDEIIKRNDLQEQLKQAVEQLSQKLTEEKTAKKSLETALARADRKILETEHESDLRTEFIKFQADLKIALADIKNSVENRDNGKAIKKARKKVK